MEKTKPIKRSPAIIPLSKDHHYALLLVWKIREGFKRAIAPERISRYVLHNFEKELIPHFKEEEEMLLKKVSTDNKLRVQTETEHKEIHQLIAGIKENPSDKNMLQAFADSLEKHVRFEERQLFNHLQETISETELSKIASELKEREHEPDSAWDDVFWDKTKK